MRPRFLGSRGGKRGYFHESGDLGDSTINSVKFIGPESCVCMYFEGFFSSSISFFFFFFVRYSDFSFCASRGRTRNYNVQIFRTVNIYIHIYIRLSTTSVYPLEKWDE